MANLGLDKRSNADHSAGGMKAEREHAVDVAQRGNDLKRDAKVVASVGVIAICGVVLGGVLMGIFVLEAFVAEIYDGWGKEVVVSWTPSISKRPTGRERGI